MTFRKFALLLTNLTMIAALVACSSSSSKTTNPISVAFSAAPPASLQTSAQQALTAVVSNDSSASPQVSWSVACGSAGACGSFSSTTTASGSATTYSAPSAVPIGGSVTVTATSVTDNTKSTSAMITITAATTSALPDGIYIFSLVGQDSASVYTYNVTGAFAVASGVVTGGEQDFVNFNVLTLTDQITGGAVTATADGNIQITLNVNDTGVGVSGVETLNAALVSSSGSRALITEFDSSATSSGELDLQTSIATGPGGYAFFVNGVDFNGCGSSLAGVANVDGSGTMSGAGSVFDIDDCGTVLQAQPIDSGTVSSPDAFGRIQISLILSTSGIGGIGLAGYIVDGNRVQMIENNNDPNDVFLGVTGGTAFAQGANTGTFSATSVEGSSFVFGGSGQDNSGYLQVAGVAKTNADGTTVNGTLNSNDLTGTTAQAPEAFTGTYTVDPTGRVTLNLSLGVTLQLYLTGGDHAYAAAMDTFDQWAGPAHLQTGAGAFTAGSFSGNYGFVATGFGTPGSFSGSEFDVVGPASADGTSTLTATIDQNILLQTPVPDLPVTGTFTADTSGVFSDGLTGLDITTASNADVFTYYMIDTTKAVAIETDPNQLTLGYFELFQ